MAADFNAGSIEGTLGLDSSPFKTGLAAARQQAADFEGEDIEPTLGLDTGEFTAKKTEANAGLSKFDHTTATARADLDVAPAIAKWAILKRVLDAGGLGGGLTSVGLMTAKVLGLTGGLLGLISILGPAGVAVTGFGVAGIAAFGGIAVSLGLFMAAAKSAFGVITAANKAGVTLSGWAGKAQSALKGLTDGWHDLVGAVRPQLFQLFTQTFSGVASILPKLIPLLRTVTGGVSSVVDAVLKLTRQPVFEQFLHSLQRFMGGFLQGAGPVIANLLGSFMHIFIALQPIMSMIGKGIADASEKFADFSRHLQHGGIAPFVSEVKRDLPLVLGLIGSVFGGLRHLLGQLEPLAKPTIKFIEALVDTIGHLHIGPLAKGFGDVFNALRPLLPVLGHLINTLLGPLGHFLSQIAKDALIPLAHSLNQEANPAFKALHDILHALVKPLAAFVGSIANLANPTGVRLFSKLLQGLADVVVDLAPSLGALAVSLESLIDNALNIIIPLIPTFTAALGDLVKVLIPVVNALAALLAHKAVAGVILGIVGAVFLGVKAFQAYRAAVAAIAVVQGVLEAISFGWAGLTVAQDANTGSVVANKAAMVAYWLWSKVQLVGGLAAQAAAWVATTAAMLAQKAAMLVTTGAAKAMAAAQWLVNAAMDANPITLIVIAIAALAAGFIYAYKHSEKFRAIVNGALNAVKDVAKNVFNWLSNAVGNVIDFVKDHWKLLLSILTGPIGAALIYLISHWHQITQGFQNMMDNVKNAVSNGIENVFGFFQSLPGRIVGLGDQMLNAGHSLMEHIFQGLENAATSVGGFASNIASSIWNALKGVLNDVLPHQLHVNIPHAPDINVPLFPYLAKGGVSSGPMTAVIGDNPGGQEAVVPLDKYDIPKRGEVETIATRAQQANDKIVALLGVIANHLAGGILDPEALADALAPALDKHGRATMKALIQQARAA